MKRIAFIGAGNLAGSLIGGLLNSARKPTTLQVSDLDIKKCEALKKRFPQISVAKSNPQSIQGCDVVLLCVKPGDLAQVCADIREVCQQQHPLVISVAAGVTLSMLEKWLVADPLTQPLIRCMPNLPVAVGEGMSVLCANDHLAEDYRSAGETIFNTVGRSTWIQDEALMDLVTALSGSGPAYFLQLMKILEQAAQALGMDADLARQLVQQTALGTAAFAQKSPDTLETLCAKVASPGGTTERALEILDQAGIDDIFTQALSAASNRAREISKQIDQS